MMCSTQKTQALKIAHGVISLYTLSNCAESEQTRQALVNLGIPFSERSAADQSPPASPVVATIISGQIVAWIGHQPDMIELLADLLDAGPVPEGGLAYLDQAEDAVLTRFQVFAEIHNHQLSHEDFLEECGDYPLYRGSVLLDWLGY